MWFVIDTGILELHTHMLKGWTLSGAFPQIRG